VSPQYLTNAEKTDLLNAILNILDTDKNVEVLINATNALQSLVIHARSNLEYDVKFYFVQEYYYKP